MRFCDFMQRMPSSIGHVTPQMCADVGDDAAVVARVRAGHQQYFSCIIMRYEKKLHAYVRRLAPQRDDVDDIVQTVFIKALHNLDTFDARKKFSPWLYRIAHNETMNWFNARARRRTVSIDDPATSAHTMIADDTATALDEWFAAELRGALHDAVSDLPAHYAAVIRMHYFDDMSYKEIAAALDKPVSSIGTLLRRAKKRLLGIVVSSGRM